MNFSYKPMTLDTSSHDNVSKVARATYVKSSNSETIIFESYTRDCSEIEVSIREYLASDKEELYLRALKNLYRKLDFMDLNQTLECEDITEEEYDQMLDQNEDKYLIPLADEKPTMKQVLQITDIIKRLKRTEEMSIDDVSELFMLDMKEAEKVLEEPSKVRLVLETT